MCSNIYKCTIFACSSAARPADFTRLRLQSGGFSGSPMCDFSRLKELLSQGPCCLPSMHLIKEQRGPAGDKRTELFRTVTFQDLVGPRKWRYTGGHPGRGSGCADIGPRSSPYPPPHCPLAPALSQTFHKQTPPRFSEHLTSSCEAAFEDHKTPASEAFYKCPPS